MFHRLFSEWASIARNNSIQKTLLYRIINSSTFL
jgi:hypothetical protein